MWGEFKT